jgi:hypothetical protein
MTTTESDDYVEKDAPWFDADWRRDHPDYPLSATYVEQYLPKFAEEES